MARLSAARRLRTGGRHHLPLLSLGLAVVSTALLAVSPDELERYGFGSEVARSAREGTTRQIPRRIEPSALPPGPFLPAAAKLPSRQVPSPTRPSARIRLTPRVKPPAGAAGRAAPEPQPPAEPDSLVQELFPRQAAASYTGDAECLACHTEKGHDQPHTLYGLIKNSPGVPADRRGCEGCHGPGSLHASGTGPILNPKKLDHLATSKLCLSCHEDRRLVRRLEWHITGHQEAFVSCTTCHSVHHAKWKKSLAGEPDRLCFSCHQDQAAKFRLRSRHPLKREGSDMLTSQREGKVRCIDCHQPYSARNGADLTRRDGKELCTRCHAETRGPFLFEHDPVGGDLTQQCTTCHLPHGSPNRDLLIIQGRALCLRCHTDRVTHRPGPTCYTSQCHRDIHGSNMNQFFLPR